MSRGTIFAHLFGFVALVAALLVLPQAAQAHAGHAHASVKTAPAVADVSPSAQADEHQVEQSLTAATETGRGHAHDPSCDCSTCAQSSCPTCFSAVAPMPPLILPPSLGAAISIAANQARSGIAGSSLRRPPRSFA